jgi:hypothetical protein
VHPSSVSSTLVVPAGPESDVFADGEADADGQEDEEIEEAD